MSADPNEARVVQAVHGRNERQVDPAYQAGLAEELRQSYGRAGLIELYGRFAIGDGVVDALMRKAIWQAVTRSCGMALQVASGAGFKHPETFGSENVPMTNMSREGRS